MDDSLEESRRSLDVVKNVMRVWVVIIIVSVLGNLAEVYVKITYNHDLESLKKRVEVLESHHREVEADGRSGETGP